MKASISQILRFFVTSGAAASVNICARIPLGRVMPYGASIVIAYLIGMSTAFVLARTFVFCPEPGDARNEFLRFGAVNVIGLMQVLLVSVALKTLFFPRLGFTWHAETIAHVIGVASPAFTSYYAHKFFSFRALREKPIRAD